MYYFSSSLMKLMICWCVRMYDIHICNCVMEENWMVSNNMSLFFLLLLKIKSIVEAYAFHLVLFEFVDGNFVFL